MVALANQLLDTAHEQLQQQKNVQFDKKTRETRQNWEKNRSK